MEASISCCRAMRASHQSRCVSTASSDQSSDASCGNLPLLPVAVEPGVQVLTQRLQRLLPPFPDDVDLGVVGDRLERDVRHALADEALPDVAVRRRVRWRLARDLGFLAPPVRTVGEEVVRVAGTHDSGTGERQAQLAMCRW